MDLSMKNFSLLNNWTKVKYTLNLVLKKTLEVPDRLKLFLYFKKCGNKGKKWLNDSIVLNIAL